MIIVNLKGGLGNQMFQYACGRALALRTRDELQIIAEGLEAANAIGDLYRPFSLQKFAIAGEVIGKNEIPLWHRLYSLFEQKVLRRFYVHFEPSLFSKKGTVYLNGYFQSEKYFADYADTIRRELRIQDPLGAAAADTASIVTNDDVSVSLHVRRGDYVTHPEFGGIADVSYYQRAVAKMQQRVPHAHFYVFSDDIEWCRNNLALPKDAVFVSGTEMQDYEELHLMSLCRHNIIANSSFSWWGAWLNANPDKIIIAPSRWAHGKKEKDFRDIIPERWIRV